MQGAQIGAGAEPPGPLTVTTGDNFLWRHSTNSSKFYHYNRKRKLPIDIAICPIEHVGQNQRFLHFSEIKVNQVIIAMWVYRHLTVSGVGNPFIAMQHFHLFFAKVPVHKRQSSSEPNKSCIVDRLGRVGDSKYMAFDPTDRSRDTAHVIKMGRRTKIFRNLKGYQKKSKQ